MSEQIKVPNPFFTGGKIPPEKFVGRKKELGETVELLKSGQNISIIGESQIGKSSLLNYLCNREIEELKAAGEQELLELRLKFRFIYLDLQRIPNEENFWDTAIRASGSEGREPDMLFRLSQERPIILCVDEFEKAGELQRFSHDFWGMLRSYAQESTLTLIMATRQTLEEIEKEIGLSRKTSPLYNIFRVVKLGPFSDEESLQLIDRYLDGTGVQFTEEEIKEIINESGNHPARLQSLCYDRYNTKAELPPETEAYGTNPEFTSDVSSEIDQIWDGMYTQALADFITHKDTKPPLVIGINAPWGAGKSSLMKSLRKQIDPEYQQTSSEVEKTEMTLKKFWKLLRGKKIKNESTPSAPKVPFPTVWFNAWKYSKEEQLWAALVKSVIEQLTGRMKKSERERFLLELNMKRIDNDKIRWVIYQNIASRLLPWLIGGLALLMLSIVSYLLIGLKAIWGVGPLLSLDIVGIATKIRSFFKQSLSSSKFEDYVKRPKYEEMIGFLGEVEEDFKRVRELFKDQKLVIFVDDLDRCSPGKIVEVIEAINVFFGSEECQCIFVLGIDADFIAKSIECAYEPLVNALENQHFGRQFLQKIVQVSLTLPEPSLEQLRSYFNSIINLQQDVEKKPEPQKVEKMAEELRPKVADATQVAQVVQEKRRVISPDEQNVLEKAGRDVAVEMLTEKDPKVREVLEEALDYLEKKPRQVKRFLNLFRLAAILHIKQQGPLLREDFQRIAKWAAISTRYPEFTQTARQLDDNDLADLERIAKDDAMWKRLKDVPGWKDKIDDDLRNILNTGVTLSGVNTDFTTLV